MFTNEEILIAIIRIAGSLFTLKWAFFGSIFAVLVDLSDLFWQDYLDMGGIRNYQALDKILDLFYMSIFLFVALRWKNFLSKIAVFLFIFRLLGLLIFEITQERIFLLFFPNVFEFWFILVTGLKLFLKEKTVLKPKIIIGSLVFSAGLKIFHEWVLHGIKFFDQWGFFEFINLLFDIFWGRG
jgi:hypothetical protein